jgi:hypothetical protein
MEPEGKTYICRYHDPEEMVQRKLIGITLPVNNE